MASTDTFKGYPTDLLTRVKGMGRAIIGDDALYDAAQEYTDPPRAAATSDPRCWPRTAPSPSRRPPASSCCACRPGRAAEEGSR
jgi:hypothetical protein